MFCICYRHDLTNGTIIQIFYHGLDDPTQGILDARGIFLYNTPNEAFKILEDKVLLKLDFSDDSQNIPKPKTIISAGESNINPDHAILVDKFKALATKINSEFLIIRKELNEMRDGRRDNHASQTYKKDDMLMHDSIEANYVQGYHEGGDDERVDGKADGSA
nr:reverse transcriptase domain-containing protein [Tanacetum cinerariifolium]